MVAQHANPDLILLDIQMPGINGFEVCKRLQQHEQTRDIPVIFISALDEVLDKVEAFEAGGADYITKPFQILEVLARIEHQLKLRRQHKQLAAVNRLARELQAPARQLVGYATTLVEHEQAPPAQTLTNLRDAATGIQAGLAELIRLSDQPGPPA